MFNPFLSYSVEVFLPIPEMFKDANRVSLDADGSPNFLVHGRCLEYLRECQRANLVTHRSEPALIRCPCGRRAAAAASPPRPAPTMEMSRDDDDIEIPKKPYEKMTHI